MGSFCLVCFGTLASLILLQRGAGVSPKGTSSKPDVSSATLEGDGGHCCPTKTVGGIPYHLVTEGPVPEACKDGCIYKRVGGDERKRFCFAPGNKTSSCSAGSSLTFDPATEFAMTVQEGAVTAIYESRAKLFLAHGVETVLQNLHKNVLSSDTKGQNPGSKCSTIIEKTGQIASTLRATFYTSPDLVNATLLSTSINQTANNGFDCTEEQSNEMEGKIKEAFEELNNVIKTQSLYVDKMEKTYFLSFNSANEVKALVVDLGFEVPAVKIQDQVQKDITEGFDSSSGFSGTIASQNDTSSYYPNNFYQSYPIIAPPGHTLSLTFDVFQLESSWNCTYDWVTVEDSEGNTLMDKRCGYDIPTPINSATNQVNVVFSTDGSVTRRGFNLTWESRLPAKESCIVSATRSFVGLYESMTSNLNETVEVVCCTPWRTRTLANCGRGVSCSSACFDKGASLCPDCSIEEIRRKAGAKQITEREDRKSCVASASSTSCSYCAKRCNPRREPECCLHPTCRNKRAKLCNWVDDYWGSHCASINKTMHGTWSCDKAAITLDSDFNITTFSEYECRLECDPGFVSDHPPTISCIEGNYHPMRPYEFQCESAIALAVSTDGQMEMISDKCNKLIMNIPSNMTLDCHTLNLIDDKIVLGPVNIEKQSWMQFSLAGVRGGGILANDWIGKKVVTRKVPRCHISTVHGNDLLYIGGRNRNQLRLNRNSLQGENWSPFDLYQKEKSSFFDAFVADGCSVKESKDELIIIGGVHADQSNQATNLVRKVNMRSHGILDNGALQYARSLHACEIITIADKTAILVSGGVASLLSSRIQIHQDEIYDFETGTSEPLAQTMTTPRYGHVLINLGGTVYAIGGKDSNGAQLSSMEKFSVSSKSWILHHLQLLSSSTYGLAVTGIPSSSADCEKGCQCGKVSTARVVGGSHVEGSDYPWAGVLLADPTFRHGPNCDARHVAKYSQCSVSLIGSQWTVTAAHCVMNDLDQFKPRDLTVFIGINNKDEAKEGRVYLVTQIIIHNEFNADTHRNDIAILKLRGKVDLMNYPPVCLPVQGEAWTLGEDAAVVGWGKTEVGDLHSSDTLHLAEVSLVSCEGSAADGVVCTRGRTGLAGPCHGDSGGPLTVQRNGGHVLAGIVSHGDLSCGTGDGVAVYADVAQYRSWIEESILKNGGMKSCGFMLEKINPRIQMQCTVSSWSLWSSCTATCTTMGSGSRERSRNVVEDGDNCPDLEQISSCVGNTPAVDAYWASWQSWSSCSSIGKRTRRRVCNAAVCGGTRCRGDATQEENCLQACQVSSWSSWSSCSVTCESDRGYKSRTRRVTQGSLGCPELRDESRCYGDTRDKDSKWSRWGSWSSCRYGREKKERERSCNEAVCDGSTRNCRRDEKEKDNCPIDSSWERWSGWSRCSRNCGGGRRERERECNRAKYGGSSRTCSRDEEQQQYCNTHCCREWYCNYYGYCGYYCA